MVALGVALSLVPVRVWLDLYRNVDRIDMFHISHEEPASRHGASSHSALGDGVGGPVARWNALHEALNQRDWVRARDWVEYMASRPSARHEVATLVV